MKMAKGFSHKNSSTFSLPTRHLNLSLKDRGMLLTHEPMSFIRGLDNRSSMESFFQLFLEKDGFGSCQGLLKFQYFIGFQAHREHPH